MIDKRYTKDHEWLCLQGDGNIAIGITDHAQQQLGDIVYVELPEVGQKIVAGKDAAVVESVKAAAEVKIPLSGIVTEVNELLDQQPELVNSDPEGQGWFLKMTPDSAEDMKNLMDTDGYEDYVASI